MESSFLKALVGLIGTIGVVCAVGFPLSSLGRAKDNVTHEPVRQSKESEGCESIGSNIKDQQVDFGTLGNRINGQLNKKDGCKDLPGKSDLETILNMGNSEERQYKFKIQQEDYSNCSDNKPCGFLEIQKTGTKQTTLYKLRIAYEMLGNQKHRWGDIVVARIVGGGNPSYFNGYSDSGAMESPRGEVIQQVRGEDLSSWRSMSHEDAWKKIPGHSIIYLTDSHKDR